MRWMAPAHGILVPIWVAVMQTRAKEPPVMEISTIGLDLAKNVFQVHGISATGEVVIRKALRRPPSSSDHSSKPEDHPVAPAQGRSGRRATARGRQ